MCQDDADVYLKKADLVRLAQPLSDTSFTIPDGGRFVDCDQKLSFLSSLSPLQDILVP
jgi:hypothetical protein